MPRKLILELFAHSVVPPFADGDDSRAYLNDFTVLIKKNLARCSLIWLDEKRGRAVFSFRPEQFCPFEKMENTWGIQWGASKKVRGEIAGEFLF